MKRIFYGAVTLLIFAIPATSQDVSHCASMENAEDRLNCFDQAFIETSELEAAPDSEWSVRVDQSPLDDSTSVYMSVQSDRPLRARFRQESDASLNIRCRENTTSIFIHFGGHFMSDIQGRGRVDYRVDDRPAGHTTMSVSTNNEALGLWSGNRSIPFIRGIMDGGSLYVRATPFSESALEMTFNISGLDEELAPLREACNW
ncbi:type VI secretion system-associated protein TagO [Pararhodobacter sp.]|uniref:type VI secretion system-associated protein TagO n=1 Tax=Pararhodobacter sp. TaxID=2127056 RepID=UPI002FDEC8EF